MFHVVQLWKAPPFREGSITSAFPVFAVEGIKQVVGEDAGHYPEQDALGLGVQARPGHHVADVGPQLSQGAIEGRALGEIMGGSELAAQVRAARKLGTP